MKKLALSVFCGLLLTGCLATTERPGIGFSSAFAAYDQSTDSVLVHSLVEETNDGTLVPTADVIAGDYSLRDVTPQWVRFGTKRFFDQTGKLRPVKQDRDYSRIPEQDSLAVRYSQVARQRGHAVRVYKFGMNSSIAKIMPLTFERSPGGRLNFSRDYALIEVDQQGEPISALVREHEELGFFVYVNSLVFFGPAMMNRISGQINNEQFDNTFLREIK